MKITVTLDNFQKRLDQFMRNTIKEIPRSGMFSAMRKGRILLNGKKVKKINETLKVGDIIEITEYFNNEEPQGGIVPVKMDLKIIYEDQYILVIDKQKGIAVHPGAGKSNETTLINGLHYYAKNKGFTPYLTHRLDKFTSGVLIVAKSEKYAGDISRMFKEKDPGKIRKIYLAAVFGNPRQEGKIELELNGQNAVTEYRKLESFSWNDNFINLLEVEIFTGRKHQIRRHLASIDLPVAGDDQYGDWQLNKAFQKEFRIKEYLLHCKMIMIRHPYTGASMEFIAGAPAEMTQLFGER